MLFNAQKLPSVNKIGIVSLLTLRVSHVLSQSLQVSAVGSACTYEGLFICVGPSQYQQCRWGFWSEIDETAQDSPCDFHGEISSSSSAITPWEEVPAPTDQTAAKQLSFDQLYAKKPPGPSRPSSQPQVQPRYLPEGHQVRKRDDNSSTNIADSPLYHEYEDHMQQNGDPFPNMHPRNLASRDGRGLVAEPRAPADICPKKAKRSELAARALGGFSYVVCGDPNGYDFVILSPTDISNAVSRAARATMYSYGGEFYSFPHEYWNKERINMNGCEGGPPWYEFPVRHDRRYGDDDNTCEPEGERVVINCFGELCAVITHKNAPRRNGFVPCTYHY